MAQVARRLAAHNKDRGFRVIIIYVDPQHMHIFPYMPPGVEPFNFLLSLQAKCRVEMAADDMAALASHPLWRMGRNPIRPPYHKQVAQAVKRDFDRTERSSH